MSPRWVAIYGVDAEQLSPKGMQASLLFAHVISFQRDGYTDTGHIESDNWESDQKS